MSGTADTIKRPSGRAADELRPLKITTGAVPNAEGSCLVEQGNTRVLCAASVQQGVPRWLLGKGSGWVTAEYAMLPRATQERTPREATQGRQGGRTVEIQRLIGRSLRAATDLKALGERQIIVDCDVLQADAGTRCAAITGGYVALALAGRYLQSRHLIRRFPLTAQVAAVSVGIMKSVPVLDLDYAEDSQADVDFNVVMTDAHAFVELQGTAEQVPFTREQLGTILALADVGLDEIFAAQRQALAP